MLILVHTILIFAIVITPVLGVMVNTLQYYDTVNVVQDSETEDPQLVAEQRVGRNHGNTMGKIDEETAVGPRLGQDPPPSFSTPTLAYTYRQWKRDLRLWQATSWLRKNRQGRWLLRQLQGESRTAAEVVMDDALVQEDGIDLIVAQRR